MPLVSQNSRTPKMVSNIKKKCGLMSENTALLLFHAFIAGARTEHCCSGTPACRADFSIFRRKQTGNKRAHLLRKGTACSSKEFEALVVLEPAHGPTPCHCFWKSDPFFPALRFDGLWAETRKGEDKIVSG